MPFSNLNNANNIIIGPSIPSKPSLQISNGTTDINEGTLTNIDKPLIYGIADANTTITIRDGNTIIATVETNAAGEYSFTLLTKLNQGEHTISVVSTNTEGTSSISTSFSFSVDTKKPIIMDQELEYNEALLVNEEVATVNASDENDIATYKFIHTDGTKNTISENGYFQIDSNGKITITQAGVNSEVNDFEQGSNTSSYNIAAIDTAGNESLAVITLKENDINESLEAFDDESALDVEYNNSIIINVLANDIDTNSNNLTIFSFDTNVSFNGIIIGTIEKIIENSIEKLKFTANSEIEKLAENEIINVSFSYTSSNQEFQSTANVTLKITGANDAPVIENIASQIMNEDTSKTIIFNASDIDNDTLSSSVSSTNGTAIILNGNIVFTPSLNFFGNAVITLSISDGTITTTKDINVLINPIDDAPILINDSAITEMNSAITVDVLNNDTNVDGGSLIISKIEGVSVVNGDSVDIYENSNLIGTATLNNGKIDFSPTSSYIGTVSFEYTAKNSNNNEESTASVSINVLNSLNTSIDINDVLAYEGGLAVFNINIQDAAQNSSLKLNFNDISANENIDYKKDIYEYSLDGGNTWIDVPLNNEISLSTQGSHLIQVRVDIVDDKILENKETFTLEASVHSLKGNSVEDTSNVEIINNSVTANDDNKSTSNSSSQNSSASSQNITYEQEITSTKGDNEDNSEVASLEDGGYVVVWSGKDSNGTGIYSQKFDANGEKVEEAYLINESQRGNQSEPNVVSLGAGKYLVTWTDASSNPTSLRGQIMDDNNQMKIGDEFVIAEQQAVRYDPLVGLEDGGFIVTWTSNVAGAEDNSGFGVYGQRFDANGSEVGNKFLINQTTSGNQEDSDVTIVNGNIVVSYTGKDSNGNGVFTREFELLEDSEIVTRSDNFEDGNTNGWSNASVHDGGAEATQFLGKLGGSAGAEATSKTYNFGSSQAGKEVEISFDFYELDTWDWEYLKVFVNGDIESSTRYHVNANEAGGERFNSNVEGTNTSYTDTKHTITLKATLDENGEVTLGFGSTLNQSIADESFGIDNIVIQTSSVNPIGDEKLVNTNTTSNQDESSITTLSNGSYVVSWTSYNQDGNSDGIFMQKFDVNGDKVGVETSVNTYYNSAQNDSMITGLNNGSFVATWTSYGQDGSYNGIYMQRFSSDGEKLGAETQVNETTYHNQQKPSIDSLEDGGFVISWTGYNKDTASYDVYTQKFTQDGVKVQASEDISSEQEITSTKGDNEDNSEVASLEDGGYVVVWSGKDSNGTGIYSQKFDANGEKVEEAYLINESQRGNQSEPNVVSLGAGKYLVTWTDASSNPTSLRGQIMDDNNQMKIGDEFVIAEQQAVRYDPLVGLEDGGFIVTWTSNVAGAEDNSGFGVYGQRFDANGSEVGNKFLINQTTSGNQEDSDVTIVNGNIVVSYTGKDSNGNGVFTREFELLEDSEIVTRSDNFEDGNTNGWSNASVHDGGAEATQFLGKLGGSAGAEATSKTYNFGSSQAGKEVEISFDFYELDTWDWEYLKVFVNGDIESSTRYHVNANEAGGERFNSNVEGTNTSYTDTKHTITLKATLDENGEVTLGFGSTLNQSIADESFGIDNIVIQTSSVNPIGDEKLVNTNTTSNQDESSITTLSNGSYVVSWTSYNQDGNSDGIFMQKFDVNGDKVGVETSVNTYYNSAQNDSMITGLNNGSFVATWTSYGQDGSYNGIYMQRFSSDGEKLGAETQVNETTYHNQQKPSIDSLEDGGFVISWTGYNKDTASYDVYTQKFTQDGVKVQASEDISSEQEITSTKGDNEDNSEVASLEDGGYVVVWSGKDSNGTGIYSQKFDANGEKVEEAYLINESQRGNQSEPNVVSLGAGKYLVTWTDASSNPTSLRGQIMDDNNQMKIGDEFVIAEQQAVRYDPLVGLEDGGFIVTWTSNVAGAEDNSGFGVYGQRFDANGSEVGNKFLINQTTSGNQEDSDVTIVNGNIVVSYTGKDSNGNGVFTREFELLEDSEIVTRSDNFEDGNTNGWSNASVHDGGAEATQFLGKLGGSAGAEATSKTYNFGSSQAGKEVEISFDFYELDTWDWEYLKVFVNGDIESSTRYHVNANEAGGERFNSNVEGTNTSYTDTKHTITLKATLDENGEVTLGFGSTLNQSIADESFGIDNIVIQTSSVNPIGDEKLVNTNTTSNQDESSITTLSNGSYVVSWTSYNQDGNSDGIFMQKFDVNGDKVGVETSVNTYYNSAQNDSMITGLNNGSFVATWTSYGQDGSYNGIYMQRFSSDGEKLGAETQVNETTYHNQQKPSIDSLEDGGFVISWTGYNKDTASYDVYTQKFTQDGVKVQASEDISSEQEITSTKGDNEDNSEVASLEDGGYVVVWSGKDSNGTGIYSQKFDANGEKVEEAYLINESQRGNQSEPNVVSLGAGKYLVTWTDASSNPTSLRGQIMDDNNQMKIGDEFVIAEQQAVRYDPLVGLEDGGFIVTWTSNVAGAEDNSGFGVYGQRFDANGSEVGNKFLINQTTSGNQEDSDVTIVNGNIVVSYTGKDSNGNGVFTREFELLEDSEIVTRSDNFEDGNTNGWSNASVHDGGAEATQFLGKLGGSAGAEATSKTYNFGSSQAGKEVEISFDFYELDTWDWEYLKVFVNGDIESSTRYHVNANEAGGERFNSNVEGTNTSYTDTKHTITLKATLDENGEVTLGFGSTLNQSIADESFGIDNIVIQTSSVNPIGDEKLVNTNTTSNQDESSITTLSNGSYVVSWTSYNQDGNSDGIFMQKFDVNGDKVGVETSVNTYYNSAQNDSMITGLNNGSFVATWTSYGQDGSYNGIYMQRFSSDGEKLGAETQVNETTYHNQQKPSIDSLEDGGFVISWTGYNKDTASYDVYTQKFTQDGVKVQASEDISSEQEITSTKGDNEDNSEVASLEDGGYVVVWSGKDSNGTGIYSQKFDANGEKVEEAYLINESQRGNQSEPNVVSLGAGKYLVTWTDASSNPTSLRGQIMDDNNQMKIGDEFVIAEQQAVRYDPLVGLEDGGFIVTWTSNVAGAEDNSGFGVYGQRFDANGSEVGNKFLINQTTSGNQEDSDVTIVNGNIVVSYTGKDSNGNGVFTREFELLEDSEIVTRSDNFEDGNTNGWSNASVHDGGAEATQFLGKLGGSAGAEATSKTYNFGSSQAGKEVEISFDFYELDTWDWEYLKVFVNGDIESSTRYHVNANEAGGERFNSNVEGTNTSYTDTKHTITLKATLDENGEVTLGFGSTLNQSIADESFGIDNIVIQTSSVNPIGDEKLVNTNTTSNQDESSITTLSNGSYVVSWTSYNQDGNSDGIFMQKFDVNGDKVGVETSVNTYYNSAQNDSMITGLNNGSFVATWTSYGQDGSYNGIYMQRFSSDGEKLGAETQVNETTYHNQQKPSIDSLEDGGFVISWTGYNKDTASYDVYTQKFNHDGSKYNENSDFTVYEDNIINIDVSKLLQNDVDEEGDSFDIISVQDAQNGTIELSTLSDGSKQVIFTPTLNFSGFATFTYTIEDIHGAKDSATVTIQVLEVNDAPEITIIDTSVIEDSSEIIANISDIDGTIIFNNLSAQNGTLSLDNNGDITYTPNDNFFGVDSIKIEVKDNDGAISTKEFDVTVQGVNDIAQALDDTFSAKVNETSILNVLENDKDVDMDSLSITKIQGQDASLGQIINITNNGVLLGTARVIITAGSEDAIEFIPTSTYTQDASFSYTISDGTIESSAATVNLQVSQADGVNIGAIYESTSSINNVWGQAVQRFYAATYGENTLKIPDLSLVETNDSESMSIILSSLNIGVTISDGTNTFTSSQTNTSVDISSWDINNMTINPSQTIFTHVNSYTYGATYRSDSYSDDIKLSVKSIVIGTNDESEVQEVNLKVNFTETASWISSPIILDLDNDGIETIGLEQGVNFDIDADGDKDKTGWVGADDGLLVRDINNDGIINDASELFGEETLKNDGNKAKDGFDALRELDSNNDGVINKEDEVFDELKVWRDSNSDGITNEGELLSLEEANVSEISLASSEVQKESNGNIIGLEGSYKDNEGNEKEAADVWFAYDKNMQNEAIDLDSSKITNNIIDLTNSNQDIVKIDFQDLISNMNEENELIILGDDNDKIILEGGIKSEDNEDGKWERKEDSQDENGTTYNVYQSSNGSASIKLLIEDEIDINNF